VVFTSSWEDGDMRDKAEQPALAYEPNYTGHREAERRRKEVREWLKRREWAPDARPMIKDDDGLSVKG
jgi:hypothetical protein